MAVAILNISSNCVAIYPCDKCRLVLEDIMECNVVIS